MTDNMLDAITAACNPSLPPSDPGYTIAELREHWGCGEGEARRRVRDALALGRLVAGKRWRIDAAKRRVRETVYRAA